MDEHEELNKQDEEAPIQEEQAVEQQLVPFLGDDLAAAATASGTIYVTLPGICKALGLDTQGQTRRIMRTKTLARGLRSIPLTTPRRGIQKTNCLRVDKVALWLAGVQPGSMKNEEYRIKIEAYQEELAPVATQVFLHVFGMRTSQVVPTHDPEILALAEQIDILTDVAAFLREHMQGLLEAQGHISLQLEKAVELLEILASRQDTADTKLAKIDERTQRLTPAHTRQVQVQVEQLARAMVRHNKTPLAQAHATIYGRLKTRFQVGSYKETPDERFDEIMAYLRNELQKIQGGQLPEQETLF